MHEFLAPALILSGCCTYTGDGDILEFQCVSWASWVFSEKWHFDCNGDDLQTERVVDPLTRVSVQAVCFIDDLWHTCQVDVLPVIGAEECIFIYWPSKSELLQNVMHACNHIVLYKMYLQYTFPVIGYKSIFQTSAQLTRNSMGRCCVRWSCWGGSWAVGGTLSVWRSSRCAPHTGAWSDCTCWGPRPAEKCSGVLESERKNEKQSSNHQYLCVCTCHVGFFNNHTFVDCGNVEVCSLHSQIQDNLCLRIIMASLCPLVYMKCISDEQWINIVY